MGWHPCEVRDGYEVGVWKVIRKGWDLFFSRTSFLDGQLVWGGILVSVLPLSICVGCGWRIFGMTQEQWDI